MSQWVGAQGGLLRRFLTPTMLTHHKKKLKAIRLTLTLSEALEPSGSYLPGRANAGFSSKKRLGVFLLRFDGMLVIESHSCAIY